MAGPVLGSNWRLNVVGTTASGKQYMNLIYVYCTLFFLYKTGKTQFVVDLLTTVGAIVPAPQDIIMVYKYRQTCYAKLEEAYGSHLHTFTELHHEFLDDKYLNQFKNLVLFIDDALGLAKDKKAIQLLETLLMATSHHCNLSVVVTTQTIFPLNWKSLADQMTHFCLFQIVDYGSLRQFARRRFGQDDVEAFEKAYKMATADTYGYLFISMLPQSQRLRYRGNVLGRRPPYYQILYSATIPTDICVRASGDASLTIDHTR